jgi:type I restriction enzyme S subunit
MAYVDPLNTMRSTEWKKLKLHDLCKINYGQSPNGILDQNGKYPVVGTSNVTRKGKDYFVDGETIIIGRKGSIDKPFYFSEKIWVIDTAFFTSEHKNLNCKWLYYYLENSKLSRLNESTGVPSLSRTTLYNLDVICPPILEQQKISQILSTWDRAIERAQRLIKVKQRQKNQLVSRLLSGQKRFPGFQDEWKQVKLGAFLHPKFRKVVKPVGAYLRLGIRSHGKGTFTSVVDDPETIALTHLFQARKDDLIVNITFAWEGAIALVGPDGNGALVSHRFPTYVFDTSKMLPEYFKHLMVTDRFFYELDLISPGGAGRNRVMNKGDFLKITVTIPGVEEQKKIAGVLGGMNEQIDLLKKYLGKLQKQKSGLMQKLLSGEIRVKVD